MAKVYAEWGRPIPLGVRREVSPYAEVRTGQAYELEHIIDWPRPPTAREASGISAKFAADWLREHPDYELKYVSVESGPAPRFRMQFVAHASPVPLALLAELAVVLIIAAVAAVVIYYAWNVIRTIAYEIIEFTKDPVGYAKENPLGAALIIGGAVVAGLLVYKAVKR